jgi:copine 5/8/9
MGTLDCDAFSMVPQPTFVEYIKGGTELSFMVAVDFTASNLEANLPKSLHYINPNENAPLNPYANAISSVGSVLEFYDSSKTFPLYGFGGKPYPGQPANHCFALNFNESNPNVEGVYGILNTYYESLRKVQMSGPTLFQQVISQASAIAASYPQSQSQQTYHVLLIITDGVINDMDQTIDSIIRADDLPLSIIIVGVGEADFSDMHKLDGDGTGHVSRSGMKGKRDIVQFCNMQDFRHLIGESYRHACASKVLEELPKQLTDYYTQKNIVPNHHVVQPPPPPAYES